MKMEIDVSKLVNEIIMQVEENEEEFIFETIRPYCENILQIKIDKEKLKQILLNSMQKPQPKTGKWLDKTMKIKNGHGLAYGRYGCSECKKKVEHKSTYCPNCGAYMGGDKE